MGVPSSGFSVEGEPLAYRSPGGSGGLAVRNFCGTCGSLLFGTPERYPEMVTIYVGTLDDPSIFVPTSSENTHAALPWDHVIG